MKKNRKSLREEMAAIGARVPAMACEFRGAEILESMCMGEAPRVITRREAWKIVRIYTTSHPNAARKAEHRRRNKKIRQTPVDRDIAVKIDTWNYS